MSAFKMSATYLKVIGSFSRFERGTRVIFLCLLSALASPCWLPGQVQNLQFRYQALPEGLDRPHINCIHQDEREFLWFGTTAGLCRYDGYSFKLYDHLYLPVQSMILEDGCGSLWFDPAGELRRLDPVSEEVVRYRIGLGYRTWLIFKDQSKGVWVGTRGDGLAKYLPSADSFLVFTHKVGDPTSLSNDTVWALCEDSRGNLWVGTQGGLDRLHIGEEHFEHVEDFIGITVRLIVEDEDHVLWLATSNGLWSYSPETRLSARHWDDDFAGASVLSVCVTRWGELWIAGGDRFARFDRSSRRFAIIQGPNSGAEVVPGGFLRNHLLEDAQGRLWASTTAGLMLYNRERNTFEPIRLPVEDPSVTTELGVHTMMEDRAGRLWLGTVAGGIYTLDKIRSPFVHITPHAPGKIKLTHAYVGPILEDARGTLWIGSTHGVDRLDLATGAKRHYDASTGGNNGLLGGWVVTMVEDGPDLLWIGTSGGLCLLEKQSGRITSFPHRANEAGFDASQAILSLAVGKDGALWVGGGTGSGLLMRFDRRSWRFTEYQFHGRPGRTGALADGVYVREDRSGVLWFTGKKVEVIETASGDVRNAEIWLPYEDAAGELWALVYDTLANMDRPKLVRFDRSSGSFLLVSKLEQLAGRVVVNMVVSSRAVRGSGQGEPIILWFTTREGISRLNLTDGALRNYGSAEGVPIVPSDSYNGAFRRPDGLLYFGGTNGLIMFHPDSLHDNLRVPPVVVTSVKILGEEAAFDSSISAKGVIELAHRENVVSFEFAALDYTLPEKNQYAYKLEGFDEGWIYCGIRRSTMYTNLDPGTYVFHVKGSNNDGVWNESGTSLALIVHPPFWRTWWAYGCYVLSVIGLLYGAFRFQHNRMVLRHEVEVGEVEVRKLKEVSEIKSRFFANISHEFRTPLTLILGPLESILSESNDSLLIKRLQTIQRSARGLLGLVNQLLDLSKLESGAEKLHARCENVIAVIRGVTCSFESSAALRGIDLRINLEQANVRLCFDREKVEKILTNLLGNAFKFTPDGGQVVVTTRLVLAAPEVVADCTAASSADQGEIQEGFLDVAVADTGVGIAPEHLAHVFDRFYQADDSMTREQGGTGIGLALVKEFMELHRGTVSVESTPGVGSTFTVRFPLGKEGLKSEEPVESLRGGEEEVAEGHVASRSSVSDNMTPNDVRGSNPSPGRNEERPLILIVEDNSEVRSYIKESLGGGYRVREACNGVDGIDIALSLIPDLVVSDLMMPKMDGYELCRTLKCDERTSHIPVILLTAKAAAESKLQGLETGADDYLTKPFDSKELRVRIRNLIDLRKKLRDRFKTSVPLKPGEVAVTSMDDAFLKKAMAAVEQHIGDENYHTDDLAADIGMSRMQLHRKLSALTNQSPGEFIRYLRLHRAMDLLERGVGTVSEIGYMVGFSTYSSFSRCFHKQFGKSPSEVKKNGRIS